MLLIHWFYTKYKYILMHLSQCHENDTKRRDNQLKLDKQDSRWLNDFCTARGSNNSEKLGFKTGEDTYSLYSLYQIRGPFLERTHTTGISNCRELKWAKNLDGKFSNENAYMAQWVVKLLPGFLHPTQVPGCLTIDPASPSLPCLDEEDGPNTWVSISKVKY